MLSINQLIMENISSGLNQIKLSDEILVTNGGKQQVEVQEQDDELDALLDSKLT